MERELYDLSTMVKQALHKNEPQDIVELSKKLMQIREAQLPRGSPKKDTDSICIVDGNKLKNAFRTVKTLKNDINHLKNCVNEDVKTHKIILNELHNKFNIGLKSFQAQWFSEVQNEVISRNNTDKNGNGKNEVSKDEEEEMLREQKEHHLSEIIQLDELLK